MTEGSGKSTFNFRNVKRGGVDASVDVEFSIHLSDSTFVFIPKSSKELDKIDTLPLDKVEVGLLMENRINAQFKEIEFKLNKNYSGAGYGFSIDLDKILNRIK